MLVLQGLEDERMKSAAIDIFSYIVEFSPSMVREFILKEGQTQDDVRLYFVNNLLYSNIQLCHNIS